MNKKKFIIIFMSAICYLISGTSYSQNNQPMLTIQSRNHHDTYSRSDLYALKNITHVSINNNRAYPGKLMTYTAIKLCDLLQSYSIKSGDTLEFTAADKFSVLIPAKVIMSCHKNSSIAYLAIEPAEKWPLLKYNTGKTAGPFDVIWVHPEKSYISDEYWAWSVIKIVVHEKLDSSIVLNPPVIDNKEIGDRDRIKHGDEKYVSHCAGCHSMNHFGKGVIGPDLNIPKNPVEYYPDDKILKKFIRDPQSVRVKKYDRMSGSSEQFLSNNDLDDLLLYFHFMVKHKINLPQHAGKKEK